MLAKPVAPLEQDSAHDLPSRELTANGVQRVRDVFSGIKEAKPVSAYSAGSSGSQDWDEDKSICIDPCLVRRLRWDDSRPRVDMAGCIECGKDVRLVCHESLEAVLHLLEELRQGE